MLKAGNENVIRSQFGAALTDPLIRNTGCSLCHDGLERARRQTSIARSTHRIHTFFSSVRRGTCPRAQSCGEAICGREREAGTRGKNPMSLLLFKLSGSCAALT